MNRVLITLAIYALIILIFAIVFKFFGQMILGIIIGFAITVVLWVKYGSEYIKE